MKKPLELENNNTRQPPAVPPASSESQQQVGNERRSRPLKEQALNCPRCNSTNTKFCYYNNYSLTQPRYFCKTCRRYWTEGGSLRNVPVGGGSRKNKRSSTSTSTSSNSSTSSTVITSSSAITAAAATCSSSAADHVMSEQNPRFQEGGQDLNLAFPLPEFGDANVPASAMELLRSSGISQGRSMNPFMPMHPMTMAEFHHPSTTSGYCVQDFRPNSLSFNPLDGGASGGYAGLQEGSSTGRILFPFEESRPSGAVVAGDQGANAPPPPPAVGFWNGLMGNGGGSGSSW